MFRRAKDRHDAEGRWLEAMPASVQRRCQIAFGLNKVLNLLKYKV